MSAKEIQKMYNVQNLIQSIKKSKIIFVGGSNKPPVKKEDKIKETFQLSP